MFNFVKRSGKDKRRPSNTTSSSTVSESSHPPSRPSISSALAGGVGGHRASEPSTRSDVSRPVGLERLSSAPSSFSPTSTLGTPSSSARSRSRSAKGRNDPLGLTVVYEPELSPSSDVIFVHGLGGTSRATWAKGRDVEYFWPGKWLPLEPGIRTARLLSFGYNANFASTGPAPITGIVDFARDLLYWMKFAKDEQLEDLELGQRPIIFVVHSMGGLVAKQAYILGHNDEAYSDIVSSIRAMLFLATPHRGASLADLLNRILSVSIFNHSPKLYVAELSKGSPMIEALNDQFRHFAPRLDIISLYETLQTSVGPKKIMVVDRASATLGYPGEISKSLNADHHNVCKFDNIEDSNYITVRNALQSMVTKICSIRQKPTAAAKTIQVESLETLLAISENYSDEFQFFHARWTTGTCEWILSHPSFTEWVDESRGPKMLWMHALPGSGKSILSSFVVDYLLKESFCVYYFFRFGDQLKRSLNTCLRVIAFQIALCLPQFRRELENTRFATKTLEKADAKTIWEQVFVGILFKMRLSTTIYWVIDALDESDRPQLFVELMQGISHSFAPIKVLLVSRQTDELISTFDRLSTFVPVLYLPLENTMKDIHLYVNKEVQYMHASSQFKTQIVKMLVAGANGNFLWASLALAEVMKCNTQEDLEEILEGIPSGMEQLYERMERTIIEKTRPRDQKLGQMILTWAVCSRRPLFLKELAGALHPEFSVMLDLDFTIKRVCGQFVIVDSIGQIVMVHQTARDHIIAANSVLAVNVAEGHETLFKKCLSVLEDKTPQRDWNRRPSNQKASEGQELIQYAMTSWAYHLSMSSPESDAPLLLLSDFFKERSVLAWISLLAQRNELKLLVVSSKLMTTYVQRKRMLYATTNPLHHALQELDLVELWATDFLKLLGKFGQNLTTSPNSIYQQIPPFCPKNSVLYRQYEQHNPSPHALSVGGLSRTEWDDSLAKLSLGPESQTICIVCSRGHFAVLTAVGLVVLYDATTFEVKRTITHGERASVMNFSSCSNLLVTYGFRTTKVWSASTGKIIHQIRNPLGSQPFTIQFTANDTELIIASNDRLIRVAQLTVAEPVWFKLHPELLKENKALDRPVHNVPWRIAFNSDASCVAVAYRGSPLCVWSLNPPKLIRRCMRSQEYVGNAWTVVDQVIWHPNCEEVLGLYMGGQVFRWNPHENTQREVQTEASILACSHDGRFFVIGDSNGTIKLYNFEHFALIYQLSCEHMINDICFSPDSRRLYDLRGQFCSVWEPNALIRAIHESSEQYNETISEHSSIQTQAVSETFAELKDQLTAVGVQFQGRYHAIGDESGIVSVVDTSESEHGPVQLWKSPVTLSIGHLAWSCDGKYLACSELTGKVVVKKVQKAGAEWSVTPVFEIRLQVSSEGIRQVLLNGNGDTLLVKNGPDVIIWPVEQSSGSENSKGLITSPDTQWCKHPTNPALLLSLSTSSIKLYQWTDLSEVATIHINEPPLSPQPSLPASPMSTGDYGNNLSETNSISTIFAERSCSHILMDTVSATGEGKVHLTRLFEMSALESSPDALTSSTITPTPIPDEIQQHIELPLGILPKQRLIFLDKDHWMCSWRFGDDLTTEEIQKYYFLPKDWLNVEYLELSALLADGKFLIPNNGELAIIRSTAMSFS